MGRGARLLRFRRSSCAIIATVIFLAVAMLTTGIGATIDRALMPLRFAVFERAASGRIAVVEMDADSAARIRRWPWSRSHYAAVVDRLRLAGAASIVFDVDLSSSSDSEGDRAFEAALARAEGLVALPTFGQDAGSHDRRTIDALPLPQFRRHVSLASVSIRPDADGHVRDMPFGTVTDGIPRPSLSAYIAARSGKADTEFPIDMSVDPSSIPRLSFVAVRDGRFDDAAVRGRHILIGATAVEMGDRYGTPHRGVLPGVVVQALAAETLMRGVPRTGPEAILLALALLAATAMAGSRSVQASVGLAGACLIALFGTVLVAQHAFQLIFPIATAGAMIAAACIACAARDVLSRFREQRTIDEPTGLPNARALRTAVPDEHATALVAAYIGNYEALRAVLGDRIAADVVIRIAERLALIGRQGQVYRTADHQLAFKLPMDEANDDALNGMRAILLPPIEAAGRRVDVAISLGIVDDGGDDIDRALSDATLAAEAARASGAFWQRAATDVDDLERSISLMGELSEAIEAGQIEVHYQPKYHLREKRIASVEALVRWQHPSRGFVGPDVFVGLAEKSNRIGPLTLHVIEQVLEDIAGWRHDAPGVTAAVNISAQLLADQAFTADVERIVALADVPASSLIFEVTESAAMTDFDIAIATLRRYKSLGIAISMDDYGTGQSTLTYLRRLPLSELKIDRSFVQHAHINRDDAVLVRSTIALAHELDLKVVAEGVEDRECLDFLAAEGCDLVQGYLISRPVRMSELKRLMSDGHLLAA